MLRPFTTTGELVDAVDVSENSENMPEGLFQMRESEGRDHIMVRADEGETKLSCMRSGMRTLLDTVPGVYGGPKWFEQNREINKDVVGHGREVRFLGGHDVVKIS